MKNGEKWRKVEKSHGKWIVSKSVKKWGKVGKSAEKWEKVGKSEKSGEKVAISWKKLGKVGKSGEKFRKVAKVWKLAKTGEKWWKVGDVLMRLTQFLDGIVILLQPFQIWNRFIHHIGKGQVQGPWHVESQSVCLSDETIKSWVNRETTSRIFDVWYATTYLKLLLSYIKWTLLNAKKIFKIPQSWPMQWEVTQYSLEECK